MKEDTRSKDVQSIDNILSKYECTDAVALIIPQLIKHLTQSNLNDNEIHELLLKSFVLILNSVCSFKHQADENEIKNLDIGGVTLMTSIVSEGVAKHNKNSVMFLHFLITSISTAVRMHDAKKNVSRFDLLDIFFVNAIYKLCKDFDIDVKKFCKGICKGLPTFIDDKINKKGN
jgi:hypothetical protein